MLVRVAMQIELVKLFGEARFQGQPRGTRHFAKVCEALSGAAPGGIIYLDFRGADVLTGSWISAMLIQLIRWGATPEVELFFVVCNLNPELVDELDYVAEKAHVVFLLASDPVPSKSASLVGPLDPGQWETLDAVLKLGEATGVALEREYPDVKATAWNNRLRDLYERKRLLKRQKQGREQVYRPVVGDLGRWARTS